MSWLIKVGGGDHHHDAGDHHHDSGENHHDAHHDDGGDHHHDGGEGQDTVQGVTYQFSTSRFAPPATGSDWALQTEKS